LQGRASTLVTGVEVLDLRNIERTLKLRIERKQMNARRTISQGDYCQHAGIADADKIAG